MRTHGRCVNRGVGGQLPLVKHRARLAGLNVDDELAKEPLRAHRLECVVELIRVEVVADGEREKV